MAAKPPSVSPVWAPDVYAGRRPFLLARARITSALRAWFAGHDFVEVETGILQASPGNETHLHAFSTILSAPDGGLSARYLRTSPEFACKKLLAAGERRVVEFAKVFRNRERGALHHPEFTLVEWYRAGESYTQLMSDCAELLSAAAKAAGATDFSFRGRSADPFAEPERMSVAEAFARFAGIDLLATLQPGAHDRSALAEAARAAGIRVGADDSWGDIFSRVLVEKIESRLGIGCATILDQYPAAHAALSQTSPTDPRLAERFELYICGVEIANGFAELNDASEQRRRLEWEMAEKQRIYGERYPLDEDFLAALSAMPQACGIALGLDRLVMLATGAARIEQVLWNPMPESSS
jgi:elongation factor P--(R)-beta-lysine ligase